MKIHFEYIKTTEKVLKHPKYNYEYGILYYHYKVYVKFLFKKVQLGLLIYNSKKPISSVYDIIYLYMLYFSSDTNICDDKDIYFKTIRTNNKACNIICYLDQINDKFIEFKNNIINKIKGFKEGESIKNICDNFYES